MSYTKSSQQKYTEEEKKQLIANLNHEVEHRTRQFRSWLQDRLEAFKIHQEGKILRIPKEVRGMSMREFGDKYNGDVQAARRGVQREIINSAESDTTELDRKRKRIPSAEDDDDITTAMDEKRAAKNARLLEVSPKKAGSSTGPGTAQRARILSGTMKTPGKSRLILRLASPSPQKAQTRPPFNAGPGPSKLTSRPASPSKHYGNPSTSRVPSSSTFAPSLPPKTPGYPKPSSSNGIAHNTLRMPRIDESMLSVNGSPLANPFEFGMKWAKSSADPDGKQGPGLKRTKSNILISRDPSFAGSSDGGQHTRTLSRTSSLTSAQSHSQPSSQQTIPDTPPHSSSQPHADRAFTTPLQLTRSYSVTISTKDGHLLEFDPLQTSPAALDALEGITASAKKQAREEMGRLVQAASDKWKI